MAAAAAAVFLLAAAGSLGWIGSWIRPAPPAQGKHARRTESASPEITWRRAEDRLRETAAGPARGTQAYVEAMRAVMDAAIVAREKQRLRDALSLAPEAIALEERLVGPAAPGLALVLASTAQLHIGMEEPSAGLAAAERALAIRRSALGPWHPLTGSSCYQVAEIRRMTGDLAGAIALHEEALSIWQRTPEFDPAGMAASLDYLGLLHRTLGDTVRARSFTERALRARRDLFGPDSPQVAATLNRLGSLRLLARDRDEAMRLFERAQEIWEKTYGGSDPRVALSLEKQARLLSDAGEQAAARARLERVRSIRRATFGPEHPLMARTAASFARVERRSGRPEDADREFRHALEILDQGTPSTDFEWAEIRSDFAAFLLERDGPGASVDRALQAERLARRTFLSTLGGLSESQALDYERVRASGLDVALTAAAMLADARPDGGAQAAAVWDELIASRAMVLDVMASRRGGSVGASAGAWLEDVARRLPPDAVLVAYARYNDLGRGQDHPVASYLAFVMRAGDPAPIVRRLGPAERIDAAVRVWRGQAESDPRADPEALAETRCRDAGFRLRSLVWDPVAPLARGRSLALIVPDGSIGLVSFGALPAAGGRYLIEEDQRLQFLSAERTLLRPAPARRPAAVLLLGGADYEASAEPAPAGDGLSGPACSVFAHRRFSPLPGTEQEVDEIAALWSSRAAVTRLEGARASEASLRELAPRHTILHLATHGYFLQDACGRRPEEGGDDLPTAADPPLRLSGLALAGANHREGTSPGGYDGVLTAEEMSTLDLSGVEWAVLSGCETGSGEVAAGEGLLGLQRALEAAGARTTITSLWPVDDGAARIWMRHLHAGRLQGLSTVEAVRQARLAMIADQRKRGETTHPYFWAPFVAAGDWR